MDFPYLLTIIRLVAPLSILRWPLFGTLLAATIDMHDWRWVSPEFQTVHLYQNWDKGLDLYYLLFAFLVLLKFKDHLVRKIGISLFCFRLVGLALFFYTQQKYWLFFFPNIFENFFIFYLAFVFLAKKTQLLTSKGIVLVVLTSLTGPKIVHEYFMHYLGKQPWEIYNVGEWLGLAGFFQEYANYISWGTVFFIIPVSVLLYLAFKK